MAFVVPPFRRGFMNGYGGGVAEELRSSEMAKSETNFSMAVERALAIMESIAQRANGLTNAEISRKLEIPRSSASYILKTLEKTGYLRRERGTGKYLLGSKLLSLTHAVDVGAAQPSGQGVQSLHARNREGSCK
jgi:DNA-binding IscR family transcriptional regulator